MMNSHHWLSPEIDGPHRQILTLQNLTRKA
jgi:hypothetical protein